MRSTRVFLFVVAFCGVQLTYAQDMLTLEEAIQVALQKNFDVRLLQNTASLTRNDKNNSIGVFLPSINANGSITKPNQLSSGVKSDGTPYATPRSLNTNTSAGVQLVWTLFDGTRMFATRKRFDETAEQGEINVKNQMMNSVAAVISNYYNVVRLKQQIKATNELISFSDQRVQLADLKLQVGTGGKPELLQAKVDLNAQRTALITQETQFQQLKEQLNQLLGLEIKNSYETSDTILVDLTLNQEALLGTFENTNQALISARKGIEIAEAALWESRASSSPTINFTSGYNYNKQVNAVSGTTSVDLQRLTKSFTYGANISVPILNGFNVRRNVNAAQINVERQKLIYEQQKAIGITTLKTSYIAYDNAKKTLLIEEENIGLARENAQIALESFKRGVNTFIELRTAQQSLSDAYTRLINARYNAKVAETELLRLSGALVQ